MTTPAISVVLPTYNGSKFIDQSIKSVVDQTWQDWELIIINDASTDDTPAKIDWWAAQDDRIQPFHLKKNRALPGALNEGFARARGEFHTWTSDDNWYRPDALARLVAVLRQHPEIGVVYADRVNVDEHGSLMGHTETGRAEDLVITNGIGACFLYRSEVTTGLKGYDENLFGAEDYDFWLRAALRFQFRRLPEPLYFYRSHEASLTATKFHLIAENVERAFRRWLPQMQWPNDEARDCAHIEWGVRCLRAGTWETVYEPWLLEAPWLTEHSRWRLRREVLKRATALAWEAVFRRDWADFKKFRSYLVEVRDDPQVACFLARKFYPKWAYRVKDRLSGACRWLLANVKGQTRLAKRRNEYATRPVEK